MALGNRFDKSKRKRTGKGSSFQFQSFHRYPSRPPCHHHATSHDAMPPQPTTVRVPFGPCNASGKFEIYCPEPGGLFFNSCNLYLYFRLASNAFEFDVRVRKVRGFCSSSSSTVNKCSSSSSKFDFFQVFYIFLG